MRKHAAKQSDWLKVKTHGFKFEWGLGSSGKKLRERLRLECQLADDAEERGWDREIERHQRIADRIRALLTELGGPPDDTP